jgi:hypothetical protein
MAGHVAYMGKRRNAYGVIMGKPEGKRWIGRSRRKWKDTTETDSTK